MITSLEGSHQSPAESLSMGRLGGLLCMLTGQSDHDLYQLSWRNVSFVDTKGNYCQDSVGHNSSLDTLCHLSILHHGRRSRDHGKGASNKLRSKAEASDFADLPLHFVVLPGVTSNPDTDSVTSRQQA